MKRIRITLLVYVVLLGGLATLGASTRPKFQPSGPGEAGVGRYVVTLTEDAGVEDPAAFRRELALLYGARIEANASSDMRQFAVTMLASRARLLSADPRVIEVVEVPLSTAAAPPETPAPAPPVSSSRRFTPHPSGYGDNGQSGTYTYDGAGNITAIGADTYAYDTAQRLVRSVTRGVEEDYSYDAFGNRKSATGAINCLGQTTCAQTVTVDSSTNHITTINGAAVTYDDAGNIKTIAATSGSPGAAYSYDGAGNMTEAIVGSDVRQFIYTADGERIAVRQGSSWTWMLRDLDGKVLREFTSVEPNGSPGLPTMNRQWAKDYVWRDGLLLATVTPAGTLHYHLDHLGTPRLVTDANGVKVAEHAYYPFGAEINLTPHETPEEAMKFTGHERDIVAGDGHTLDYMHARYYNADFARFLSVDPVMNLQKIISAPQAWNRYSYVQNNPIGHTDPTGKCTDAETCAWDFVRWVAPIVIEHTTDAVGSVLMLGAQQYATQRLSNFSYAKPQVIPSMLSEAQDKRPDAKSGDQKAGAQDKKLSGAEIDNLEEHGHDVHDLKQEVTGDKKVSKYDLYKDKDGNITVKPKNGKGEGEPTGLNINDFTSKPEPKQQ